MDDQDGEDDEKQQKNSQARGSIRKSKRLSKRGTSVAGTGRQTNRYTRTTCLRVTEVLTRASFNILKKLGDGAYGVVYLAQKKDTL